MIFKRSLIRELTITAAALFTVSLAILFTNLILRLLSRAVGGRLVTDGILTMLGFYALQYLHILVAITLFLTVLLTLSRIYRDSEMIVWSSSGLPIYAWVRPIFKFAAPFLIVVPIMSLFLTPWAQQQRQHYEQQLESRDEITMLAPGLFREFKRAGVVVFIESINPVTGTIKNVFLQSIDQKRSETVSAVSAFIDKKENGDRFLVMENGSRYVGSPDTLDYQIVEFEQLGRRIEPAEAETIKTNIRALPTLALLSGFSRNNEKAELFWRLSIPLMALMLTLLAIPLSYVNPRMGRSFYLIAAVLIYLMYSNAISIIQGLIAGGKLSFWVGIFLPHMIALSVAWLLFIQRSRIYGLAFWRRPHKNGAGESSNPPTNPVPPQ